MKTILARLPLAPLMLFAVMFYTPKAAAQTMQPQSFHLDTLVPGGLQTGDSYCDNLVINCVRPDCHKGYVTGNNRYGLREVLLKYRFENEHMGSQVLSAFIAVGRKIQVNANTPTYAVFYSVGPDGYPDSSTRVVSVPITMSQLHDGVYQHFTFSAPVDFVDSFFVGFVLPVTSGDTIGVFQTKNRLANPCATAHDTLAYERYADGHFAQAYDTWETVFELGIKVEILYQALAIRNPLAHLVQVRPVPASGRVSVSLSDGIVPAGWKLLGMDGRIRQQANSSPDSRSWNIDRDNAPAGVYLLQLNTAQGPILKRIAFTN